MLNTILPVGQELGGKYAKDVMPAITTTSQSFMGGFNDFLGGVKDTFGTLLEGGLMYENYRAQKDAIGQGQADVVNAVQKTSNPNAQPISADQYASAASGGAAGGGFALNSNMLMIGGAALALLLLMRK